jgi:SAM-dependent methyltransferase
VIRRLKRATRHVVERVLVPHLDDQTARIDQLLAHRLGVVGGAPAPSPILDDFNHRLHELRTIELRELPVDGGVLLSAGCAGRWYFDWVAECAGPLRRHVGVELYSPEPAELPADVTWIAQSASSMPGVADASVDVVFSGQNIEHLWIEDLVGFLQEANRVLRPGGTLVIDSPNRLATEALGWVHPEHTIEMTAGEITELLTIAGFRVTVERGLWRCRHRRTGAWMPLIDTPGDVAELLDRAAGRHAVDDAFVWWIEAERIGDRVDVHALTERVRALFDLHWQSRVNRAAGCVGEMTDGGWRVAAGTEGVLYRTHGLPLFPGSYRVSSSDPGLLVRLVRPDGTVVAEGAGGVAGVIEHVEFGVAVELVSERPLAVSIAGIHVTVDVQD